MLRGGTPQWHALRSRLCATDSSAAAPRLCCNRLTSVQLPLGSPMLATCPQAGNAYTTSPGKRRSPDALLSEDAKEAFEVTLGLVSQQVPPVPGSGPAGKACHDVAQLRWLQPLGVCANSSALQAPAPLGRAGVVPVDGLRRLLRLHRLALLETAKRVPEKGGKESGSVLACAVEPGCAAAGVQACNVRWAGCPAGAFQSRAGRRLTRRLTRCSMQGGRQPYSHHGRAHGPGSGGGAHAGACLQEDEHGQGVEKVRDDWIAVARAGTFACP